MGTEQVSEVLSISKRGRQLQELPSVEKEEVSASPQKGLNFRPILRTIQRKALLILGITGVVGGGTFYWANSTINPVYEGSFRILVEPVTSEARIVEPSALARSQGQTAGGQISNLDYATQLEVLKSPKMLSKIHERVKQKYPKLSYFALEKGVVVQRLIDKKSPEPTKILEVRYGAENPEQVKFVLDVVSNEYLKYSLTERTSRIEQGSDFIDEQLKKELNPRVNNLRSRLQTLQQQYKLSDPKSQADQLLGQLREITNQQAQTQRDLQEQKSLYVSLQKQLDLTPDEAVAASALSEDPNYRVLQAKIQEIDNQIAIESGRFLSDSPTIQSLQDKRRNLIALQESESQRILGQNITGTTNNPQVQAFQNSVRLGLIQKLVEADNQIKMLDIRNQALSRTRNYIERQTQEFPRVAREYTDIQGQLEIANRTREQLLTQREALRVEAAQKQYPWELVAKPGVPTDPNGKPIPGASQGKNMKIMGLAGGLLLGVAVALLIEKIRDIFYSSKEMKEDIPLPLLGVIPLYKRANQLLNSNAFVESLEETESSNKSAAPFLEAFDSLYANIRFLFSDPPIRSLAVCSAKSGDGKTTVALHLAQTAAAMGQRVLLVDANFRRPQLHSRLDLPNQKGLSDLLAKKLAPDELIQRSPLADNLFVLTSGQPLPNSTKLLASAHMQYLMEEFQATFDLVIYDTSHLVSFMDANFLAAHTDGILMVVGVRKTSRSVVMQVLNQLNTFRLPTLGIVANHVRKGTTSLASNVTTTDLKIVDDELQVPHPTGKWIDFQQDKINNRKSS
jgi:capsular exopolysaccharide synthesis family protein